MFLLTATMVVLGSALIYIGSLSMHLSYLSFVLKVLVLFVIAASLAAVGMYARIRRVDRRDGCS
jgi:membrane protein implicated in regulation of membrane protease activity